MFVHVCYLVESGLSVSVFMATMKRCRLVDERIPVLDAISETMINQGFVGPVPNQAETWNFEGDHQQVAQETTPTITRQLQ